MTNQDRLVPLLAVRNALAAIDFYRRAFGATVMVRYDNKAIGTVSHADLAIDGGAFSLTEEASAWGADAPPSLGGTPVVLQLLVADVGAAFQRAVSARAEVVFPVQEFCGENMCRLRDPFGHVWLLHQRIEALSPEENQRRRDALFADLAAAGRTPRPSRKEAAMSTAPAIELARRIREKEISSLEMTQYFIERIERLDPAINAVVVRDFERAVDAARRADAALARGDVLGPLHGVPMTIKESFDVVGLATTWGAGGYEDNVAHDDAVVVARFRAAGAHFLGKTNVPFMLGDFQAHNDLFGTTNNPWDTARTPGGSSGGSAAALAAGLTSLETGSDIGGSVRNPAHYCGIYAHKPTAGILSMHGHRLPDVPATPDMAVAGPLARSGEDLDVALDVLAAPDPFHAPAWQLALPPPRTASLRGLRVAVWADDPIAPVDEEIAERARHIADVVARHGGVVSDRARPRFDVAAYRRTYVALVSSVMGAVASDAAYEGYEAHARTLDRNDTSKAAAAARGLVLNHRAWLRHDAERTRLGEVWRAFFGEWDVLVCPIMATTAFRHDRRPAHERTVTVNGAPQPYFDQVFWASLATLAYLPSTVFPCLPSKDGLPIGLQAVGGAYSDRTTIAFARWLAELEGGFVPPAMCR
jgi:amidase